MKGSVKKDKITIIAHAKLHQFNARRGVKERDNREDIQNYSIPLKNAKDLELITKNVTAKTRLPKGDKGELTGWNEQEVNLFLKAAQDNGYSIFFHMVLVIVMRQGKLLALRWKDVDLEKGHLTISQTLSHDEKMFLAEGKTKSSLRKILLPYYYLHPQ